MEKFHLPVSAHWLFCFPWNLCCCKEWLSVYSDDVSRFFVRCCLDLGPRLSSCPREQLSSLWTEKNEYVDEFGWCANNLGGDMDLKGFIGQISKCVSHCLWKILITNLHSGFFKWSLVKILMFILMEGWNFCHCMCIRVGSKLLETLVPYLGCLFKDSFWSSLSWVEEIPMWLVHKVSWPMDYLTVPEEVEQGRE